MTVKKHTQTNLSSIKNCINLNSSNNLILLFFLFVVEKLTQLPIGKFKLNTRYQE